MVGRQPGSERTIVHFINYTGHQERAFYEPISLHDIHLEIQLPASAKTARAVRAGVDLELSDDNGVASVAVPRLDLFEVVVFE